MAAYTVQSPTITGHVPTYTQATASDTVRFSGGSLFLIVRNTGAGEDTCTVVVPGTERGQQNPDVPVTVPATNGEVWIGPLESEMADSTTDDITITHSAPAGVTVAAIKL